MVPLKTAIRELNAGFEALGLDPDDLQKLLPGPVPERFEKGPFTALPWEAQVMSALSMARKLAAAVSPAYSPALIRVEKQSEHPDDWYLWTVLAVKNDGTYTVWTMNLSTGGLCHGHYDIQNWLDAYYVMDNKRGHREPEPPKEDQTMYPDAIVGMNVYNGTDGHDCPPGGDISNDCDGCAYSGDYHYDYETRDCVPRSHD